MAGASISYRIALRHLTKDTKNGMAYPTRLPKTLLSLPVISFL